MTTIEIFQHKCTMASADSIKYTAKKQGSSVVLTASYEHAGRNDPVRESFPAGGAFRSLEKVLGTEIDMREASVVLDETVPGVIQERLTWNRSFFPYPDEILAYQHKGN